jgi:glutaredoxin
VDYRDVKASRSLLEEMMALAGGGRQVPVIVEAGRVTIGYGGT